MKPDIIVITGPTATGKTALAICLSQMLGGEVVSGDSMQVYKYMDIGTAKPSIDERRIVPHHMIDVADPREDYSVARYVRDATACICGIKKRGRLPVIAGGTGFYIDSLLKGREFASRSSSALRRELEEKYDRIGGKVMLSELARIDPERAAALHENDKKRVVRAFEVLETTGAKASSFNTAGKAQPDRYTALKIILDFSGRNVLYDIIRRRVDDMMSKGLEEEVASLLDMGIPRSATSMQAIGYKQIAGALCGGSSLTEAVEKVKMESTRYAKRQLTWLRREGSAHRIYWDKTPDIARGAAIVKELLEAPYEA